MTDPFTKAIRDKCAECEDTPAERAGEGWEGQVSGFCPVQGTGSVDDKFWYFRARHDAWSFEVYTQSCAGNKLPDEEPLWMTEGEHDGASWMKFSDAWALIEASIAKYRAG